MAKKNSNLELPTRGTPNRRGAPKGPRRASERRAVLLESAGRLFVERGYDATTMNAIAADAGFAKGTLYHYFANKADLLLSLREEFDKKVLRRVRSEVDLCAADDCRGRIKAWIVGAVDAYLSMTELHDVLIYGTGMPFRNAMTQSEVTRLLAALIEDGVRAGVWTADDSHWIAVMMFYCFRGDCDEVILGEQSAEDIPERLHPLFLRMLGVDV